MPLDDQLSLAGGATFRHRRAVFGLEDVIQAQFHIQYDAEGKRTGFFAIGGPDLDAVVACGKPVEGELKPPDSIHHGFLARGGVAVERFNFHTGRCVTGEFERVAVVGIAIFNRAILADDCVDDWRLGRQDDNVL
ncbi:hypothetical protein D9M71_457190 [compost metagenome]